MDNILNSLNFGKSGHEIYISVSPALGIEMMTVDAQGSISSYAQGPLVYNEARRDIANYDSLQATLENLFERCNVSPKGANIHFNVPTVWFGLKEGLPYIDDDSMTNIIIGELEQTYIFKKEDPIPLWFDAMTSDDPQAKNIFYSAVQEGLRLKLEEICKNLKAHLIEITCSLFSDLKGLSLIEPVATKIAEGEMWSLMIVNNNGFQVIGLSGNNILEYYEEPLAIRSYEGEEIYAAIENPAQIALMGTVSNSLVIVSETDSVSAEILAKHIQFSGDVIPIEDNQYKKEPLSEMSLNILPEDQIKVSLSAIGMASPMVTLPINTNFLAQEASGGPVDDTIKFTFNGKEYVLDVQKATVLAGILLAAFLIPLALIFFISQGLDKSAQDQVAALDSEINQVQSELSVYENKNAGKFDADSEIERVVKNNRTKIMAFSALGESIPKNIYLTYFMTGNDGFIDVKGYANTVEDVYVFFKNLKDCLTESNLRLSKLDLKANSLDTIINDSASVFDSSPYIFEITNMDEEQLKSFMDQLKDAAQNAGDAVSGTTRKLKGQSSSAEQTDDQTAAAQ